MTQKQLQARQHRTSALNLRTNAKAFEEENPERMRLMLAEADHLEALAAKLDPKKPEPQKTEPQKP